jgi:signal transduction histidine kinase/CheY-like chemotaxis protein
VRKFAIGALTIGVLLTMAALRILDLSRWRAQTIAAAESRATNLSLILAEYVSESFAAGDASLRQLALHSQRIGGPAAPDASWNPSLTSAKAGLTGIGSLSVTDRDGIIRHSTQPAIVGQSRRDDYVIRRLSAATDDELAVDTPFLSVSTPRRYLIPIARRLTDEHGAFAGAIVATLTPAAPRGFFRTVDVGRRGVVWVFHPDGFVVFREPTGGADPIGQSARDNPIFAAATGRAGSAGILEGPIPRDGPTLLSAFHTTTTPPLIVAVSLDRSEVLTEWRHEAVGSAALLAVLALTLAATLAVLYHQIEAKTHAELTLARSQQLEAARLTDANQRLASALEREQHARRDAETASALKDQFLMTVSHELRTPLTAICGWARMLVTGVVDERLKDKALRTIERNALAQTRLIDDLLDVSRAMTGALRLDIQAIEIDEIVQHAVDTIRPAADAKAISLDVTIEPGAHQANGDAGRLQQIIWNLLSNAVKFTPHGGRVGVKVARAGGATEIRVSDTGVGISAGFLPHVFERFRQEDPGSTRRFGGLGLGLAIARNLIELHGGSITAQSDGEGRGATFVVRLPAQMAAGPQTSAPVLFAESFTPADGAPLTGLRILVADDDAEARELFAHILEAAGAEVTPLASADEALSALDDAPYHVLLSDIEMPGADGYRLAEQALSMAARRGERLVAIAITAYSRPEDEVRSLDAGFERHLCKPIDPQSLVAAIRSVSVDAGPAGG